LGGDGISDESFITTAGSSANGTYYTVAAPQGKSGFVAAYRKRFGVDVGAYSANGYAAAVVAIAAIEKAAAANGNKVPARAQVLQDVAATSGVDTPIGVVGFDKNGDTTNPALSLYSISGGKAHFAGLISVKI
jgi:branched-chain amino acid transport system substrate-binding protein